MKVSKRSWHYRWITRMLVMTEDDPVIGRNKFFGWMLFPLTVVKLFQRITPQQREDVQFLVPKSLCGYFWANVLGTLLVALIFPLSAAIIVVIAIPYALLLAVGLALRAVFLTTKRGVDAARQARAASKGYSEPQPSLVLEFVKAKKRRVCPLLTYVD